MAITTAFPTSAKVELFSATHDFTTSTGHAFKMALFKDSEARTYGAATTNYSDMTTATTDEVASGGGYTTGGNALTIAASSPTSSGTTAWVDFDDEQWTSATFTTSGALIYNTNAAGNQAVYVGDFNPSVSVTAGTLTVQFPAADASNAILRL